MTVVANARGAVLQCHNSQLLDRPLLDTVEALANVYVLHGKHTGTLGVVDSRGPHDGKRPGGHWNRLVAGNVGVGGKQLAPAIFRHEVNTEMLLAGRPERDQEIRLIEWVGILELVAILAVTLLWGAKTLFKSKLLDLLGETRSPEEQA